VRREYHRRFSPVLRRDMELLVFGHAGARTIVFPTRSGRFYDYENWRLVESLRPTIESGNLQLFCVDSIDSESLYCQQCPTASRLARHEKFERYILDEVLPFSRELNDNPCVITHGCSIGAFHAVNLALRHPEKVSKVVGLSGRYDLSTAVPGFRDLFDGHYDENVYFHTPTHFVPGLTDAAILERLRRMEITLVVGEDDPFAGSNRELSEALRGRGVANELNLWPGEAHRASCWRRMVPLYL
jgi:esterase/lipase superfamily enzyme